MAEKDEFDSSDIVSLASRTLLAAGYQLSGVHRQPCHIEFKCERITRLGVILPFLIAITDKPEFNPEQVTDIRHAAENQNRVPVFVSLEGLAGQLAWRDFLDALGGGVPSWRALTEEFERHLQSTSQNVLPSGLFGEAWQLFETLVADGLEFCFGRRVNRLGAHKRGKKVSDMIAPLPDFDVVVVDAKASAVGFDATWPALRALVEYVDKQKERQQGGGDVAAALILSSKFQQRTDELESVAKEFLGETRTPLCFMTATTLAHLVKELRVRPDVRNAIRWKPLLSGGLIQQDLIAREIKAAITERSELREF